MSSPAAYRSLTPAEVADALQTDEEIFLIDIREPRPFHAGHIADAISLPAGDFADRYTREIDPEDAVIVVCERGENSIAAARFLSDQGFANVATMAGGMLAWIAGDGPLVGGR